MNEQTISDKYTYKKLATVKVIVMSLVCIAASVFVPLFGFPLVLIILLLLTASTSQTKQIVKIALALFVCGAIVPFLVGIKAPLICVVSWFLPYIAAPLLAIIAFAIQLRQKPPCGRIAIILMVPFLLGFFLLNVRTYIIGASPYIYMPPSLTKDNFNVYKECIKYVRAHEELKTLKFEGGMVSGRIVYSEPNVVLSQRQTFTELSKEIEASVIAKQLVQIMCSKFERYDDFVVFYKGMSPYLPMTEKEIWHIWPSGHGVTYSLNGSNPNQSNNPVLVKYRPFIKICGNWYFSRSLLMKGNGRQYYSISNVSKALIDNSSDTNEVDPNWLYENL